MGKTRTFKNVQFFIDSCLPAGKAKFEILNSNLVGQFAKVKITDATPWGLKGKSVEKKAAKRRSYLAA